MVLRLYKTDGSPPTRAVYLLIKALNLEVNFEEVNILSLEQFNPEYLKINVQHTVPCLDDDGWIVWESHAIMPYLVDKYGKDDTLYPKDLKKRTLVNQRLYFDSGTLFVRGQRILQSIYYRGAKEISEELLASLQESYDTVEKFLERSQFVAGDQMTIADFSFLTSITSLEWGVQVDEARWPRLKAWMKVMQALPYYEVNVVGNEKLHGAIRYMMERNNAK